MALLHKATSEFRQWVWSASQDAESWLVGFLAVAVTARAVCAVSPRMAREPWLSSPGNREENGLGAVLKEIVVRRQSLDSGRISCRDHSE